MPEFDAIIIGTGQARPSLARRLVAADKRVAIIERAWRFALREFALRESGGA